MATRIRKASEYSEINMTVRAYMEKIEHGDITFDIEIQRGYVWKDIEQKSLLIQSLIINDIIPPFIFNKIDGKLEAMDCKQRSLTIQRYLNDEFALKGVMEIEVINDDGEIEELDINGLKFSELPKCCQNAIQDCNLKIWFLDEADQDQVARNFYNLNNGTKINAAATMILKAKSKKELMELGKHQVFKESLTKSAIDGHVNTDLVAKAHAILHDEDASMNAAWVRKYMVNTLISEDDKSELEKIFDRILKVHSLIEDKKVAKRIYGRTHIISIVPIINRSINEGKTDEQMMDWFVTFFAGKRSASISSIYNSAAGGSGTGKKEAVRKRVDEIEKHYNSFFKQE